MGYVIASHCAVVGCWANPYGSAIWAGSAPAAATPNDRTATPVAATAAIRLNCFARTRTSHNLENCLSAN